MKIHNHKLYSLTTYGQLIFDDEFILIWDGPASPMLSRSVPFSFCRLNGVSSCCASCRGAEKVSFTEIFERDL